MTQALKVLIAEDDRMTRRILQVTFSDHPQLQPYGASVILAEDGALALHHFKEDRPDLVLLDLFMPRVDGFALCQHIRETEHGAQVPIIVMSAIWKQPQMLERLQQEFGVEFLEKPFNVDTLAALVTRMIPPPG